MVAEILDLLNSIALYSNSREEVVKAIKEIESESSLKRAFEKTLDTAQGYGYRFLTSDMVELAEEETRKYK